MESSDYAQLPPPKPRGINTCLVVALLGVLLVVASVAIVVIAGGDRFVKALEVMRGGPQVVTVQITPGEMLPVLKLAVAELHTTVHTTRTGPVLGGIAQSLPRHIIAQGSVTACFNLEDNAAALQTTIDPDDPLHITVRLPQPEYCYSGIDNAQYFDEAGLALPAGTEVNGQLLDDAKKQLFVAADEQQLLAKAKTRGVEQIQVMLLKLGFNKVDVEFAPEQPIQ